MDNKTRNEICQNIFPMAQKAIEDWDQFPWHIDRNTITTGRSHSSQALAIDVMGTLKVTDVRHAVLNELAKNIGIPQSSRWNIELEWKNEKLLSEPRPTQADAIAFGDNSIILFECKFREKGGSCSQKDPIRKGPNKGVRQCDGLYHQQTNPASKSRCRLSDKKIKYWEYIPEVFNFSAEQDITPCPFAGSWYQYMRNLVLASALKVEMNKETGVVLVYAAHDAFPTFQWVKSSSGFSEFKKAMQQFAPSFYAVPFQDMVQMALKHEPEPSVSTWHSLQKWVNDKIENAALQK